MEVPVVGREANGYFGAYIGKIKQKTMSYFWAKTTLEGKPGISVYQHMINVGCVASYIARSSPELLERFQLPSSLVGALSAIHDIGKISPGFQRKCPDWLIENGLVKVSRDGPWDTSMEPDHGKVSHVAIQTFLLDIGIDRKTTKFVSAILGAHHGRLSAPNDRGLSLSKQISDTASQIDWDYQRKMNAQMVWEYFLATDKSFKLDEKSPAIWWLAGLTSVADWIGSDEQFFSSDKKESYEDATLIAPKALDAIGLTAPTLKKALSFEDIFGFSPNEMQEKAGIKIKGPGVYVLEAPMGMGKTEAALFAAYKLMVAGKASGVYFALPTQATSNRIHLRMNNFLQKIAPEAPASRLIHGNSWLIDSEAIVCPAITERGRGASDDARTGRDWFNSAKRALIAPFGVGTIDQALLSVVASKHFFVRQFALAGKVVILDEVHSYDIYTGTLIDNLVVTLEKLGCTVIILSATLTGKRRGQIVSCPDDITDMAGLSYPLISGRYEGDPVEPAAAKPPTAKTVEVDFVDEQKAAEEAVGIACKGGAVIWICNTVDAAQKQYRRIKKMVNEDEFPIGLLHSRFPFRRREKLETEWMERFGKNGKKRCGSILVSTQVVEQSVDLDADLLITELAPTDMLLQRIGRLWRHERQRRPIEKARVYIIEESRSLEEFRLLSVSEIRKELGDKAFVYDPFVLLRSLEVWKSLHEIIMPEQIRRLIESTYEEQDDEPESWRQLHEEASGKAMAYRQKAIMSSNIWQAALEDEEGAQTRLNEIVTVSVVLCRSINRHEATFADGASEKFDGNKFRLAMAQAIHKNLVKVPRYCFESVHPCPEFNDYLYGEQCAGVIIEDGTVEVAGIKDGSLLYYSDEVGLIIEKIQQRRS